VTPQTTGSGFFMKFIVGQSSYVGRGDLQLISLLDGGSMHFPSLHIYPTGQETCAHVT